MRVRLTQIDGSLPNLALMKLAHWHRGNGHEVVVTRSLTKDLFEGDYDAVYGSCIFKFSANRLKIFLSQWPGAIVGGTGTDSKVTVEQVIGTDYEHYDYSGYPDFKQSIGFTQRGCRLKCKFCVVPEKEGKPKSINSLYDIWRGEGHPKQIHILDNDFFGQPAWRDRVEEMVSGNFHICLSQGINVRLIDDEAAKALSTIQYRDTKFQQRRLYTAWDNLRDEKVFFAGIDKLEKAGIPAKHIMAYMLVGFDPSETWERIMFRFGKMVDRGIMPYPMVFDQSRADLKRFQRWAILGLYRAVPWEEYQKQRSEDVLL